MRPCGGWRGATWRPGYLDRARSTAFPWDAHRRVAQLGVLGLLADSEHNPLDREDHVAAGLAVEELAYADFNVANAVIPVLLTFLPHRPTRSVRRGSL